MFQEQARVEQLQDSFCRGLVLSSPRNGDCSVLAARSRVKCEGLATEGIAEDRELVTQSLGSRRALVALLLEMLFMAL